MGNSSTSSPCGHSQQQILQQNFNSFHIPSEFLSNNSTKQSHGNVKIVEGKQKLRGHIFSTKNFFNPLDSKNEISQYFDRFQGKNCQQFPIIKVYGVKQMQQNNFCSSWKWYYVITEHIVPFDRIQSEFSFQECVYVLFEALMGFFYLYAKFRSFKITQRMIGINSQGKVKVWLNENYAQNHPQNQTIELYLTKNFKPQDETIYAESKYILQRQMIRQVLNILNKKFKGTQNSFEVILRKRIREFLSDFSIKSCGFKQFLQALSILQQKSGEKLYIPNKIKLQKEISSNLPKRQSFSQRLQRAIIKYNSQIEFVRKQQETRRTFTTGRNGISHLKKLKQQTKVILQKPQVTFNVQTPWRMSEYNDLFGLQQTSKKQFVRYAESEAIGISGPAYNERLEEFNFRPLHDRIQINNYVPGDYEAQIEMLSKDMRETYFLSTKNSRQNLTKSRSINHDQKFSRSNSESQFYPMSTFNSSLSPNNLEGSFYPGSEEKNFSKNIFSKINYNLIQINEELQAKQESMRPSMMSINVEGRNQSGTLKNRQANSKNTFLRLSNSLQGIDQQQSPYEKQQDGILKQYQQKKFFTNENNEKLNGSIFN